MDTHKQDAAKQPEALVRELLDDPLHYSSYTIDECRVMQSELRRLHAENESLRSALEQQGVETDTTRLEFMQFYGAQVCWGNDSEVCDVRWYTHWGEQELRRTSNHNDWRVAIDEAIEMEKKP